MCSAQTTLTPAFPEVRDIDNTPLPLAWLGGLNAPQFNASDLDGDGTTDLLIFDRAGDVPLALRGNGDGTYTEAPELTAGLPDDLVNWLLLRDYDGDGNDDLFAHSDAFDGFRIYRGERGADGLLRFPTEPTYRGLDYPLGGGTTPIFVSNIDYPAVDDIDMDGDLDILTFSVAGGFLEYYQNQSIERGLGLDTLVFTLGSECFGGFFESGLTAALDLSAEPGECYVQGLPPLEFRHVGSTTLSLDADGNGLKDVLLGDISFESLVLGLNTGTLSQAHITEQDISFPRRDRPVDIPFFPAAFHLDVDGDGARDLLAAPNQKNNAADINVAWYYRNVGTDASPNFAFQDSQFLIRQSLDYGSGSIPASLDYDADGRPDLVVGNTDAYDPGFGLDSRLRLLRNTAGPGGEPIFTVVDEDFLGLRQFQATTSAFAPAFGDLDGDGDVDAIVGERVGTLIYFENTAGPGQPVDFAAPVFDYQGIDAGQLAKPALADLDRDGLTDLIVGGLDGRIRYFVNRGSPGEPIFDADPTAEGNRLQVGGINTNRPGGSSGHAAPLVLDYDDRFLLLTGNRAGTLEAYEFTNPLEEFVQLSDTVAGLDVGLFSVPAAADFNGDGQLELIVGNERGGVQYYRSDLGAEPSALPFVRVRNDFEFGVFPNPTTGGTTLTNLPGTRVQRLRVYDGLGRIQTDFDLAHRKTWHLRTAALSPGMYVLQIRGEAGTATARLIVR